MRQAIRSIQKEVGITTVYVTHDQEEAMSISDTIAVMKSGSIQHLGAPRDIYQRPSNLFVATFIGRTNVLPAALRGGELVFPSGYAVAHSNWSAVPDQPVKVSVRPEEFIIGPNGGDSIPGTVVDSIYLGLNTHYIVDVGPGAGEHGGEIVAVGTARDIIKNKKSITGAYLSGRESIPVPEKRAEPSGWIRVLGAKENNLKNIDVDFPLGIMTCITGVSGSGKSSLVNEILYKHLARDLNRARTIPGKHKDIEGIEQLDKVIAIDQSPIGRTPRSNPATYTGVFDLIRDLFAATADAKARGYKKGRFSFNVKGGRCEACAGDGILKIEMHFLPDVYVPCEVCHGKRYNRETLEVKYKGKNIYDVLNMTVEEAMHFFENVPSIRRKMETLYDVGLSYIRLGQPSTQLSGGEAQRIKLASELSKRSTGKTIYILDEPTTGLHFADVHKLTEILRRLSADGNTVIVIEHNLDVIKTADYIIDMGPEGGDKGGTVIAQGTPEEIAENPLSYTGRYIRRLLFTS